MDEKGSSEQTPDRVRTTGSRPVSERPDSSKQEQKWWVPAAAVSSAGIAMALSLTFGVLGGHLLDKHLGTGFFFWIGLVVGILAAYRSLWVIYVRHIREK